MMEFEASVLGLSDEMAKVNIGSSNNKVQDDDDGDRLSTNSSRTAVEDETHDYEVAIDQKYVSSTMPPAEKKASSQDFERLCVLGRGAFGEVFLVKHRKNQTLYAMKVLKKASLVLHVNHVKTERQILEQVRHPFIVQLFYAFQTPSELHMILEYAVGGELFRYLDQEGMFSEPMASFYAAEIVLALSHLHSLGIVYRDLKPENCLLDRDGHVRLTDFGLSKVSLDGKTNTICGTAEYMAPETLTGLQYDETVDWWSLGILIYDMLTGAPPFRNKSRKKTIDAILSKKITMPYYFTAEAKDILNKLLRKNPQVRLGAKPKGPDAIRQHRFFRKIDWERLAKRQVTPPIIPVVTDPEAAENFDPAFTSQSFASSSTQTASDGSTPCEYFKDFSFVDMSVYTQA